MTDTLGFAITATQADEKRIFQKLASPSVLHAFRVRPVLNGMSSSHGITKEKNYYFLEHLSARKEKERKGERNFFLDKQEGNLEETLVVYKVQVYGHLEFPPKEKVFVPKVIYACKCVQGYNVCSTVYARTCVTLYLEGCLLSAYLRLLLSLNIGQVAKNAI